MSRRRPQPEPQYDQGPAPDRLRPLLLGSVAALIVATPLIPTEKKPVLLGESVVVLMLLWWAVLVTWSLAGALRGTWTLKLDSAMGCLLAFLAWHSLSAVIMSGAGQPRASLNMLWLWLSFGTLLLVVRQLIQTEMERRAIVAVMISLSIALSALGFYQYLYELPQTRRQYEKDPGKILSEMGIEPDSPQRKLFEDRLYSTEPLGTFALTNSLAGFLSPWFIVATGIALTSLRTRPEFSRARIAAFLAAAAILGCLVLTKSRTAWIASAVGLMLVAIYIRRSGWRPDGRIVALIIAAGVTIPFLAIVVGGLDWLVVLESSKSFLYRVQYWRATAELISDHLWFGCGPGNFQQYYTAYKLPEASETIAEPHNFLLEIWATAGTPGLLLMLALATAVIWKMSRSDGASASNEPPTTRSTSEPISSVRSIYWGALVGSLLAYGLCTLLEGYSLSPGLMVFGLPAAAVAVYCMHRWVIEGELSQPLLSIAAVVMLINFIAAGGISFAGVAQSLWLLVALLLVGCDLRVRAIADPSASSKRLIPAVCTFAILILAALFHQTEYSPVTTAHTHLSEAQTKRSLGQFQTAIQSIKAAAAADPYSPEPWDQLAELTNELWLQTGSQEFEEDFREAGHQYLARNPHSSHAHTMMGHRWFVAYRRFEKSEYLQEAIENYRIAVKLYPNYNLGHAQLAWVLDVAQDQAAHRVAEEALRLDALNPHEEQKLKNQKVFDPKLASTGSLQTPLSAEQLIQRVRSR